MGPVTHLTFDCYGTLIDWETGILGAIEPALAAHGVQPEASRILELYVKEEARLESQPWRPYTEVLREVSSGIAQEFGILFSEEENNLLPNSIAQWPPFSDTVAALRRLKQNFRLVVLSNIDDELFAGTARQLEVPFDVIITAEQVRSYKPGEAHFREALHRLNVPAAQVLHVAQSLYHDHVPAQRLGFQTAWVNRPSRLKKTGLAPAAAAKPDLVVRDLAALAAKLLNGSCSTPGGFPGR